jgi:hypothetical protein
MRTKLIIALLMGAFLTAAPAQRYVRIPWGHTNTFTRWWTNSIPDAVTNWQAWQAQDYNLQQVWSEIDNMPHWGWTNVWTGPNNFTGGLSVNGVPVGSGGGSQTPWTGDVDAQSHRLDMLSALTMTNNSDGYRLDVRPDVFTWHGIDGDFQITDEGVCVWTRTCGAARRRAFDGPICEHRRGKIQIYSVLWLRQ